MGLTLVAALGGWVWLGLPFAALWFVMVLAATAANRAICAWMERRPPTRRLEWALSAVTFVYTGLYCLLPYGLAGLSPDDTAWLAGVAMIGAIALSSTSEFVISRRIGLGSMTALLLASVLVVATRAEGAPVLNLAFSLVALGGFFACILQFAMHRVRDDRRFQASVVEAEAANAAKSIFLATMSHEIRTPLNGVLGMAQAMAMDDLSPLQRERLAIIRDSGEALTTVLNDVLDLSKIEAGKLQLESLDFDLGEMVRSTLTPFAVLASEKGLDLTLDVEADAEGRYRGDRTRLRQVLTNLISNAVKFTETGGVAVSARRDGEMLRIAVRDTGPGVPADQIGKLFGKFAQLDASTTRRHGGTGLGLAICRELCTLMNGTIGVESLAGEGATFTVALPLERIGEAGPASGVVAEGQERSVHPGLRVLAAEDNRVNQIVLETLLGQIGVTAVMVGDGAAAIERWAEQDWDLILMDVHMPVLDGVGAVREIRAREAMSGRGRTPIIALTANAMTHQVADLLAVGMDRHVAKPISAADLFSAMEMVLDDEPVRRPSALTA